MFNGKDTDKRCDSMFKVEPPLELVNANKITFMRMEIKELQEVAASQQLLLEDTVRTIRRLVGKFTEC